MKRPHWKQHPWRRLKYDFDTDNKYNVSDSMHISEVVFTIFFIFALLSNAHGCVKLVKLMSFVIISILGYLTIRKVYKRLNADWNQTHVDKRIGVYGLLLKMIGLYSIFILGVINYHSTSSSFTDLLSAFYISFIILADLVSISVVNNEIEYYLPRKDVKQHYIKLYMQKCQAKTSNGKKLEIKAHTIQAKVLKK